MEDFESTPLNDVAQPTDFNVVPPTNSNVVQPTYSNVVQPTNSNVVQPSQPADFVEISPEINSEIPIVPATTPAAPTTFDVATTPAVPATFDVATTPAVPDTNHTIPATQATTLDQALSTISTASQTKKDSPNVPKNSKIPKLKDIFKKWYFWVIILLLAVLSANAVIGYQFFNKIKSDQEREQSALSSKEEIQNNLNTCLEDAKTLKITIADGSIIEIKTTDLDENSTDYDYYEANLQYVDAQQKCYNLANKAIDDKMELFSSNAVSSMFIMNLDNKTQSVALDKTVIGISQTQHLIAVEAARVLAEKAAAEAAAAAAATDSSSNSSSSGKSSGSTSKHGTTTDSTTDSTGGKSWKDKNATDSTTE
jgi:hypothetical protein